MLQIDQGLDSNICEVGDFAKSYNKYLATTVDLEYPDRTHWFEIVIRLCDSITY